MSDHDVISFEYFNDFSKFAAGYKSNKTNCNTLATW